MSDFTKKGIGEFEYYQGEHAIPGIKFRSAGKGLGVSAWGMNVLEIDAGCLMYPEHDHVKDQQEEVYVILRGTATLRVAGQLGGQPGGEELTLNVGDFVRVGPATKRKIIPGAQGVTVLALGGTPGQAYPSR
jgi:mannose-6-phosphate isomerase-like protein (cupin superfamily)